MSIKLPSKVNKRFILAYSLLPLLNISCQDFSTFIRPQSPYLASFDKDNQDWGVNKAAKEGYSPKGGNPGGYLYGLDISTDAWFFMASDSLIHESRRGYGKTLSFDLEQSATDQQATTSDDVVLTDGITTLTYNTACNPGTTWTSYSIKLDESAGWENGKKAATRADFQKVLTNLHTLKIRGEFRFGPDRGGLDNVSLK